MKTTECFYFYENDGLQNQSILYRKPTLDSTEREVFLDPNKLSDDGTVALTGVFQSKDGKYTAYTISRSGSDWTEIYVMDTKTKELASRSHQVGQIHRCSMGRRRILLQRLPHTPKQARNSQTPTKTTLYIITKSALRRAGYRGVQRPGSSVPLPLGRRGRIAADRVYQRRRPR